jgi:hypothetical protein
MATCASITSLYIPLEFPYFIIFPISSPGPKYNSNRGSQPRRGDEKKGDIKMDDAFHDLDLFSDRSMTADGCNSPGLLLLELHFSV